MNAIFSFLFGNVNAKDILRALLLAIIAPFVLAAQQWADALKNHTEYHFDWKITLMTAIGTGVLYLLKQMSGLSSRSTDGK